VWRCVGVDLEFADPKGLGYSKEPTQPQNPAKPEAFF
jgi:hypothetical protein